MVRTTLPAVAVAAAILGLATPSAPALACGNAQCPLTVSMEPTGPAPQTLAAQAQAQAQDQAASSTSTKPVRLDRFRKSAKKATRSARQETRRARSKVAQRSKSKNRRAEEAEVAEAAQHDAAPKTSAKDMRDTAKQIAAAGDSFALQSSGSSEVKVVAANEVNKFDLAAGPAPAAPQKTVAMVATPVPVTPTMETTGRATSLDSLQRELSHEVAAQAPASSDESWMRKMLLVLGGAFAAAAAAARLLLAA